MKLSEIDGVKLAREVVCAAVDRVYSAVQAIDLHLVTGLSREDEPWDPRFARDGKEWPWPRGEALAWGAPESTTLGHAVLCLTAYAQRGTVLDADVHEYCVTLIGAADEALDDSGQPDPSTPLGLVVAAAFARERLATGKEVKTAHLAALGGVSSGRIRQLVDAGDLRATVRGGDIHVRAADAKRWLSGRGVPGYTK